MHARIERCIWWGHTKCRVFIQYFRRGEACQSVSGGRVFTVLIYATVTWTAAHPIDENKSEDWGRTAKSLASHTRKLIPTPTLALLASTCSRSCDPISS